LKWTVVWLPAAEHELANLWLKSSDRRAIAEAADWLDHALKHDPEHVGKRTGDGWFLTHRDPLAVAYKVIPDDCMVRVLQVTIV
jgi:hypothetical protein